MRIVALSDQHGYLPAIPDYDLLIVAGDICPDRFGPFLAIHHPLAQKAWFDNHARPWLARARAQYKIVTWGNHDWCGQACSFREYFDDGQAADKTFIVVDDAVRVPTLDVPAGSLLIWATPWSNRFLNWAFMKDPNELEPVYAAIPDDVDILGLPPASVRLWRSSPDRGRPRGSPR